MIGFKEKKDTFLNSIFAKSLAALYKLNQGKDGRSRVALIDSIYQGLVIGKDGLELAKLEMALATATDDWLDYWGYIFAVPRLENESDDKYRDRMIWEIIYPKNTLDGIKHRVERYIKDRRGVDAPIRIFEPWTKLLKTDDKGRLDGEERLVSYDYWNYGFIDITFPDTGYLTEDLLDYLKRIKAAGVQLVYSFAPSYDLIGIDEAEKERKRYAVYFKDLRRTEMEARAKDDVFRTASGHEDDSLLDKKDVIMGRSKIVENALILERVYYATGVLRNHLGSAVLNLTDYIYLTGNENMTVGDAIGLEEEAFNGTRPEEGRLTYLQAGIDINKQNYVYSFGLVRYDKQNRILTGKDSLIIDRVKEEKKIFNIDESHLDSKENIGGSFVADSFIDTYVSQEARYEEKGLRYRLDAEYKNKVKTDDEILSLSTDEGLFFNEDIRVLDGESKLEGKEKIIFGLEQEKL